jgi:hypothetical protein
MVGGAAVAVDLKIGEGQRCANPEGWQWGSEQACPRKVAAALTVQWGSQRAFVPVSAYADLAGVRSVSVAPTPDGFSVHLDGGDAATSYRAVLKFEGDPGRGDVALRSREVRSVAFQDEVWETTQYHNHASLGDAEPPIRNP